MRAILLLLPLALALAACDGGPLGSTSPPATNPAGVQALDGASIPFLSLVPDAPQREKHAGRRRVAYDFEVAGQPQRLEYVERVAVDGEGQYSIVIDHVSSPSMTAPQREVFELLQDGRQGFFFKYRDLRIRDLPLFLENYVVELAEVEPIVADIHCVEIVARRRAGGAGTYRLAIDPRTGLVLRTEELDANGQHVASSEFLSIAYDADLSNTEYHVELYAGEQLVPGAPIAGLVPTAPQVLPDGFREIASDLVVADGRRYVRRVYGDGLENLFFLQREPASAAQAPELTIDGGQRKVRMAQFGTWKTAELASPGGTLFVVSKASEADVLAVLASVP